LEHSAYPQNGTYNAWIDEISLKVLGITLLLYTVNP